MAAQFSTDGGYYGGGSSPIVNLLFDGNLNIAKAFGPRQFTGPLQGSQIPSPGLYPVSIVSNAPLGGQPPFNSAIPDGDHERGGAAALCGSERDVQSDDDARTAASVPSEHSPPRRGNCRAEQYRDQLHKGIRGDHRARCERHRGCESDGECVGTLHAGTFRKPDRGWESTRSVAIDDQIDLTAAGFAGQDLGVVVNSADSTLTLVALPSGAIIGSPRSSGLVQEPNRDNRAIAVFSGRGHGHALCRGGLQQCLRWIRRGRKSESHTEWTDRTGLFRYHTNAPLCDRSCVLEHRSNAAGGDAAERAARVCDALVGTGRTSCSGCC